MDQQATGGDPSSVYQGFNGQQQQNVNIPFDGQQQQYNVNIPFDQQQQQNMNMPFNIQQQRNVNMSFIDHQQQQPNLSLPFIFDDFDNIFIGHQHELQPLPLSYYSPPTLSPSHHDITHSSFRTQPPQLQQEQNLHMQIQKQQHNLQMQIQQDNAISNCIGNGSGSGNGNGNGNGNGISNCIGNGNGNGSMALDMNGSANAKPKETVQINGSATPVQTNGEKKKRGRPRNTDKNECNGNSSGAITLPLKSAKKLKSPICDNGRPGNFRIIIIAPGEDVLEKITDFWKPIPSKVAIISANGSISNVNFRDILSGDIINRKGEFEILSLSRSYEMYDDSLRVALMDQNGRIFRGAVAGLLVAASHVEVVVGVFSSHPINVPGQVANKGPCIDESQGFGFQSPSSIAGPSKTEMCAATNKSQGLCLQKITEPNHQDLRNRKVGVQIEANWRRNDAEITGPHLNSPNDEFESDEAGGMLNLD